MHISVNGKMQQTKQRTAFAVRDELVPAASVVILNGFALSEDRPLHDKDQLTLIEKGKMPPQAQLEGMMAARHTPHLFAKLKAGRVAVAGLGGLGSNIAVMLARIGVGHLLLVDYDLVEPSNLNRQYYDMRHLGMEKTKALAGQIEQINPFIEVRTVSERVTANNAAALFDGYDIVCEAFDDAACKAMLVSTLLAALPKVRLVAASGMAGYGSANRIITKRQLSRLYLCGDEISEAKPGQGLMAPRVLVCAGHQANMVVRLLSGEEEP